MPVYDVDDTQNKYKKNNTNAHFHFVVRARAAALGMTVIGGVCPMPCPRQLIDSMPKAVNKSQYHSGTVSNSSIVLRELSKALRIIKTGTLARCHSATR